jgi:hypothetical protein
MISAVAMTVSAMPASDEEITSRLWSPQVHSHTRKHTLVTGITLTAEKLHKKSWFVVDDGKIPLLSSVDCRLLRMTSYNRVLSIDIINIISFAESRFYFCFQHRYLN